VGGTRFSDTRYSDTRYFYRDDSISQARNVSTMFRCVRRTFEHYSTNKVDFLTIKVILWLAHTITVFRNATDDLILSRE